MEEEYWQQQGYNSIEEYIRTMLEGGAFPNFNSVQTFHDLFQKGLLKTHMVIRTSDKGIIDEHYGIDDNGNLFGIPLPMHGGLEGTFSPEEILKDDRISSGWTIESISTLSHLLREKYGPDGI
jgi:hypothetical protein